MSTDVRFVYGHGLVVLNWMQLLKRFGLAEQTASGMWKLLGPIKGLFSKSEVI